MKWQSMLAELKVEPKQVSRLTTFGLRALGAIFVGYIAATTVATLMMMVIIEKTTMSGPSAARTSALAGGAGVVLPEINYRDIKKVIVERNLFNMTGELPDEPDPETMAASGLGHFDENAPCRKCTLNVDLLGTIYLGEARDGGFATIKEKGYDTADVYKKGDKIIGAEQALIHKIEPSKVVINNNGVKECLELALPKILTQNNEPSTFAQTSATSTSGGDCGPVTLEEGYVVKEIGEGFAEILKNGRLIPHNQDNQMQGFKLIGVNSGSLYGKICLKEGDVITQVNDISMQQPEQGFALYQALQDEREVRISFLRNGKDPMTVNVQIK